MFSLNYRELWSSLSQWLTDELDQMAAAAQAAWGQQHAQDGTHTAVTTTSLVAPSLGLGPATTYQIPLAQTTTTTGVTVQLPEKTSLLILDGDAGGTYASVDEIVMPDVEEGHILAVIPRSYVRLNSKYGQVFTTGTGTHPGNRMKMNADTAPDITVGADTFGQTNSASVSATGVTFVRINRYDFTDSVNDRFPAWVQIG